MKHLFIIVLSILFTVQSSIAAQVATNPFPSHLAINVNISDSLTWVNPNQTVSVNVYLNDILENEIPITKVIDQEDATIYEPPYNLYFDTTYVWRVDWINKFDVIISGDAWEFTTQVPELSTIILLGFCCLFCIGMGRR